MVMTGSMSLGIVKVDYNELKEMRLKALREEIMALREEIEDEEDEEEDLDEAEIEEGEEEKVAAIATATGEEENTGAEFAPIVEEVVVPMEEKKPMELGDEVESPVMKAVEEKEIGGSVKKVRIVAGEDTGERKRKHELCVFGRIGADNDEDVSENEFYKEAKRKQTDKMNKNKDLAQNEGGDKGMTENSTQDDYDAKYNFRHEKEDMMDRVLEGSVRKKNSIRNQQKKKKSRPPRIKKRKRKRFKFKGGK